MGQISYRCDNCGRFISERDFDKGATRNLIDMKRYQNTEIYETLCIKCNKMPEEAS
jgi:hypothetical protein